MYRASWDSLCLILANGLIQSSARNGSDPFRVVWYKGDTTESINYLKSDAVVIGITYTPSSEKIVTNQGIAKSPVWYAWHDHLLLVGPTSNPANLSRTTDLKTMFSDLYGAAEGDDSEPPVRFLKRYDKSATSIKDSRP
jgi:ABC-type tungstate transport system permease subunit